MTEEERYKYIKNKIITDEQINIFSRRINDNLNNLNIFISLFDISLQHEITIRIIKESIEMILNKTYNYIEATKL